MRTYSPIPKTNYNLNAETVARVFRAGITGEVSRMYLNDNRFMITGVSGAILLEGDGFDNSNVDDNRIAFIGTPEGGQDEAIRIETSFDRGSVSRNEISPGVNRGIILTGDGFNNLQICNNNIRGVSGEAIFVFTSSDTSVNKFIIINSNLIEDCDTGVRLHANDSLVSSNLIMSANTPERDEGTNNTFQNNKTT